MTIPALMEKVNAWFVACMTILSCLWRQLQQVPFALARWQTYFGLGLATLVCWLSIGSPNALAGLNDDRYEGDIFALYAGNGSLVPPRVTLKEALQRQRPILLVFYIDDSRDCKQFSPVISQLQGFYGKVADFIPLRVDALPPQPTDDPTEPGYYYQGYVPQTVLLDAQGKVVLTRSGILSFEEIDDVFRQVFDLLPRSESVELKRRPVNEINTELVRE